MEEWTSLWAWSDWNWGVLGLLLAIIEVIAPGVFFLWFGLAALTVGLILWIFPEISWQIQLFLFAFLGVTFATLGRRIWAKKEGTSGVSDDPMLNRRAAQYIGRTATLETPIVNGRGRIHLGDSQWPVAGPDLPIGTPVKIVGVQANVLNVLPLN